MVTINETIIQECEYAPRALRKIIRKGRRGVYQVILGTRTIFIPTKGTASRAEYSQGLSLEQRDALVRAPIVLDKDTEILAYAGASTPTRYTLPSGTTLLRLKGGSAAQASTLWYRLPGVKYLDV